MVGRKKTRRNWGHTYS